MPHVENLAQEMQECIQTCQDCQRVCTETAAHCLTLGGMHAAAGHMQLLLACAEICRTSATFLMLGSSLHTETCAACARVCLECARSCERNDGDTQMMECAQVCRRCAQSCQAMARP